MFIIGIVIFLAVIVVTIVIGTPLIAFFDLQSLFFILGLYFAILIATNSLKDFAYGMKCIIKKNFQPEKVLLLKSLKTFKLLDKASLGIGLTGLILGMIGILNDLDDLSKLGPALSVTMLIILYCLLINLIFIKTSIFILNRKS